MFAGVVAELEGLGDAGLAECLQGLEQQRRTLEASVAALVNVARRRDVFRADGHVSVRGWVKALINCSDAEVGHFVRLGELLHDIDECGEQLHAGEVGVAAMAELARARRNPRCGDQLGDAAPILLEHAAALPFSDFKQCVKRWELITDPDGAFKDVEANHQARTASLHESDGSIHLRAAGGTAAIAAEMKAIFDRFCHAEFLTDWDEVVAANGEGSNASMMARTDPQRRFDALAAIFRAAACAPLDARVPEPTVNLMISEQTFARFAAQAFGTASPSRQLTRATNFGSKSAPVSAEEASLFDSASGAFHSSGPFRSTDPFGSTDQPGRSEAAGRHRGLSDVEANVNDAESDPMWWRSETTNGTIVHPAEVVHAALVGHIRRVVYDSAGVITDVGRRQRLFTGVLREAVMMHSRTCIWPGCEIPAGRCEADHLDPWKSSRTTTSANGAPLCRHHNRTKNNGFITRRDSSGRWHTYRPDGTELTQPPIPVAA
jgi:Domain of unknown function (DUF222)